MVATAENALHLDAHADRKCEGFIVAKLPDLSGKNRYANLGNDYDRCCIPPIQLDFKRGTMRTLQGLIVKAGPGCVSYVEGRDSISRVLGIYYNPDSGMVTMTYRLSDTSPVYHKEFENLGIRFRAIFLEERI